jgi:photosystem II stability/assembly factor-like uncharacterized protein
MTTASPYVWRNVEINGGGFVSGVIFHPTVRNLIYARTDIGGAYRWNATTRRWIAITDIFGPDDWNMFGIESLAVDPSDANRVYIAAGTYTNDWAGNGAILRSSDQGKTWARTNLPFKNGGNEDGRSMGERLAVDPNQNRILFFGTRNNGLWQSTDAGVTWQQSKSFPLQARTNRIGCTFVTFDARSGRRGRATPIIYIGVAPASANDASLYRSRDGGVSWQAVPGAPTGLQPHHGVLDARGMLYLTYGDGPGPNGMTDGAVWKLHTPTGAWTNITPVKPNTNGEGGFGYAGLSIDGRRAGTLMVATMDRWSKGDDIFRSTDEGRTWKSVKAKSKRDATAAPYLKWGREEADLGHWIGDLEIDPFQPGHVLYVTGATIWGSNDVTGLDSDKVTNWSVRAAGIEEVSVSDLISPPEGPHLISGMRDIGGFRHDDLTVSPVNGMMTNPRLSRNESLDFAQLRPSIVVRVGDNNGGSSTDHGATWTPFATKPATAMGQGPISVSADGAVWVWTPENGVAQVTRDNGSSWAPVEGLPAKAVVISDRATAGTFYALDSTAKVLWFSVDGAKSFTARGPVPDGFTRIVAVPRRAGHLWLIGSKGLQRSTDGGTTWQPVLSVAESEALGFGKAAPNHNYDALYLAGRVGVWRGVFRSDDEGATWTQLNDARHQWGWIGKAVTGDPRVYGRVFVATNGRGILWGEPATSR